MDLVVFYFTVLLILVLVVFDLKYGIDDTLRNALERVRSVEIGSNRVSTTESSGNRQGVRRRFATCDTCGRVMEAKDLPEHVSAQHTPERDTSEYRRPHPDQGSVRGELIEDYNPDWLEDESDEGEEVVLQEATGGEDPMRGYRPVYERVTRAIKERGRLNVTSETHVGQVRGGHVVRVFREAVRRHPNDDLENYGFDGWGSGDYPVKISREN